MLPRLLCIGAALLLLSGEAFAQTVRSATDTLSSNGDSFVMITRGMASARIQTLDSYTGTWEAQCSVDGGVTYDADDELNLTLDGQTSVVQSVSDTVGVWAVNVAGCTHIKIIATAGFAASDTVMHVHAISVGGGVGAGGGSSFDGVLLDAASGDPLTNTTANTLKATLYNTTGTAIAESDGGSGAVSSNTTRVVIATDDPVNDAAVKTDANLVAHDAADAGNPLKVGAKAIASLAGATMVAAADRTDLYAGLDGVLITRPHANLEDGVQARTTNTDGASTSLIAAQGAGIKTYLTTCTISNSSASFATVDLEDGVSGTAVWTFPVPATGGVTHTWSVPLEFSANTAVAFNPSAATTTIAISCVGFKSKL